MPRKQPPETQASVTTPSVNLHLGAEVTLDTGNGIDNGTRHLLVASFLGVRFRGVVIHADGLFGMLSVPSALLLELGAVRHAAGGLHAEAMDDQGDSFDAEDGSRQWCPGWNLKSPMFRSR